MNEKTYVQHTTTREVFEVPTLSGNRTQVIDKYGEVRVFCDDILTPYTPPGEWEDVVMERAEQVIRDVHKDLPDAWLGGRQRYVLTEAIAKALADARREGMNAVVDALEDVMSQDADILTDDAVWKFIEAQRQASKERKP